MDDRRRLLVIAGALALCLVAGSSPRVVGDGGEYLTQAMHFAELNLPPMSRRVIPSLQQRVIDVDPVTLGHWDIVEASVMAHDSRRDFLHFWFYALLATPAVWLTSLVGASPLHAFTILNLVLLGGALWLALPRIGAWASLLLFGSPLIWWLDKAHTEVFTVSLLTIALVTMRERPWWAFVAAGAATTQNPPITAVLLLLIAIEIVRRRRAVLADRRLVFGAAAGLALAALHPVYMYLRYGTPSLLLAATRSEMPQWPEISAVVLDPSMGLIGNYPLFLLAIVAGAGWLAWKHPRACLSPEMAVALAASVVFLYSFARTSNLHHGGTPSISRYALWLIPMTIPLWAAVRHTAGRAGQRMLATAALASALVSLFAFHPAVPSNSREPTWLASWLWTRHPTWNNPPPEVFSEVLHQYEMTAVPTATTGCEKILVMRTPDNEQIWPVPCLPAELPLFCSPGVYCYANRRGSHYEFARVSGQGVPQHRIDAAWPRGSAAAVERIYQEADWATLAAKPAAITALRSNYQVRVAPFGDDSRFLLVLEVDGASPQLRFRPATPLVGQIVDASSGDRLVELRYDGPAGEAWDVPIPSGRDGFVILTMHSRDISE